MLVHLVKGESNCKVNSASELLFDSLSHYEVNVPSADFSP